MLSRYSRITNSLTSTRNMFTTTKAYYGNRHSVHHTKLRNNPAHVHFLGILVLAHSERRLSAHQWPDHAFLHIAQETVLFVVSYS